MKTTVIMLAVLLLLNGCTSSNSKFNNRFDIYDSYIIQNNLISKSQIYSFKLEGWNPLDNFHLILTSAHKKYYLITLKNYCNDLTIKPQIYFDQAIDNRLSTHFDSIIVPSELGIKCALKSIHVLNKKQKDELLSLATDNK
jgi:hypothetical protein